MQQEYLRSQEDADEALRAALVKVSQASQEYERELQRRESLQHKLNKAHREHSQEKDQWTRQYQQELLEKQHQWQTERDALVQELQNDCNTAFENRKREPPQNTGNKAYASRVRQQVRPSSPTFTIESFFPRELTVNTATAEASGTSRLSPDSQTSAQLISPAHSDIESVLKETEDLISSIL
jgi:hypothetical protein